MNKKVSSYIRRTGMKLSYARRPVTIRVRQCPQGDWYADKGGGHRIVGVYGGNARIEGGEIREAVLGPGQIVFLPRHTDCTVQVLEGTTVITYLFEGYLPVDTAVLFGMLGTGKNGNTKWTPILGPDRRLQECLRAAAALGEMTESGEFCELKARELILTALLCRGEREVAHWLMPLLQARDNFEEFVRANHDRARGVTDLARMAGMGLSTFKRKFASVFGTSVYQWMMKQKAMLIREQIEAGNDDIQELMARFGFHCHSHFNRFCHMYLGDAPSRLGQKFNAENQSVKENLPTGRTF